VIKSRAGDTGPVTRCESVRLRRATLRLSVLAAVLLLAGLLPWLTDGPLPVRLVALPLLLTGAGVAAVAVRLRSVLPTPVRPRPSAPPVERACDGCACGGGGRGAATAQQPPAKPPAKPPVRAAEPAGDEPAAQALDPTAG
jgi:hypothetical protein